MLSLEKTKIKEPLQFIQYIIFVGLNHEKFHSYYKESKHTDTV